MPKELRVCVGCSREFVTKIAPITIRRGHGRFCSTACSTRYHRRGKPSNNWQGGRKIAGSGHVLIHVPSNPQARSGGYALEHRVVMARELGRKLKRNEVVHHLDGNPANNDPNNLSLMTQSEHLRLHNQIQRRGNKLVKRSA